MKYSETHEALSLFKYLNNFAGSAHLRFTIVEYRFGDGIFPTTSGDTVCMHCNEALAQFATHTVTPTIGHLAERHKFPGGKDF